MGLVILWSAEQKIQLEQLFTTLVDGAYLSHRAIGAILGKSRNAIIGQIHRMKLSRDPLMNIRGRDNSVAPYPSTRKKEDKVVYGRNYKRPCVSPAYGGQSLVGEAIAGPMTRPTNIVDVDSKSCRFPLGHVGEEGFHLCGGPITKGHFGADSPYCEFHHRLCYHPPNKKGEYKIYNYNNGSGRVR